MGLLQDMLTQPPVDLTPPSDTVWHYTDADALLSICKGGRLWASHASGLNDSSELRYGWEVCREAFQAMRKDLDRTVAGDALDQADAVLAEPSAGDHYVLSASADKDVLNQWQHYGSRGFALGLPALSDLVAVGYISTPVSAVGGVATPVGGAWRSVLYSRPQQLLHAARSLYIYLHSEAPKPPGSDCKQDPDGEFAFAQMLHEYLAAVVGLYKHPAFHAERECRMVFTSDIDSVVFSPLTRVAGGEFLQYLEVGGTPDRPNPGEPWVLPRLPIAEVRCGPTPQAARAARMVGVERMLTSTGYPVRGSGLDLFGPARGTGVDVSASDLPYSP